MERHILHLSPENLISVAIMTAAAYFGLVGAKMLAARISAMRGA
jgi:hypothetical protein